MSMPTVAICCKDIETDAHHSKQDRSLCFLSGSPTCQSSLTIYNLIHCIGWNENDMSWTCASLLNNIHISQLRHHLAPWIREENRIVGSLSYELLQWLYHHVLCICAISWGPINCWGSARLDCTTGAPPALSRQTHTGKYDSWILDMTASIPNPYIILTSAPAKRK